MAQRDADGLRRTAAWSAPGVLLGPITDFAGRFGRHWFMLGVLFGGLCLAIRGSILLDYGVAFLFREDRPPQGVMHSQAFLTEMLAMLLAGAVWVFAVDLDPTAAQRKRRFDHQLAGLSLRILPLGLLPLLAFFYPGSKAVQELGAGEAARALMGWGAGFGLTLTILAIASVIEHHLFGRVKTENPVQDWARTWLPHLARWIHWNNAERRVVILWVMYVFAWAGVIVVSPQLPVVAIFALIGVLLAGYVLLNFFIERMRFWVFLALLALPAMTHVRVVYPYIFADFEKQYVQCDELLIRLGSAANSDPRAASFCGSMRLETALADAAKTGQFLRVRPERPLEALKTLHLPPHPGGQVRRPKLVVVTISGGAYRAAFWGALVLDRLAAESAPGRPLEGLAQSIRLLTGASGGMVPAAYFVMQPPGGVEKAMERDIASANGEPGQQTSVDQSFDSLTPIARQLVQNDLINSLLPWRHGSDRGKALEDQWKTLDVTFDSLRAQEADGRRPSLIFSPMIAETGQPLLISNLDLADIPVKALSPDKLIGQAVDLFKKMPEAPGLLKLKTAVRMSATFPFVSPSVSLPTIPPLHVLDAGYFDNYGMSIALGYLKQASVLAWLKENTSGVILIQINAFATPQAVEDTVEDRCREPLAGPSGGALGRAFTSLTSPIAGLVNSRGASMVFRNELELDSLKQLFGQTLDNDRNPLRFDSIMFENAARASFSWYLPQGDLACMREQLNGQRFAGEFTKLTQAWDAWTANVTSANDVDPVPPEPQ